jgi:hypothetical protein
MKDKIVIRYKGFDKIRHFANGINTLISKFRIVDLNNDMEVAEVIDCLNSDIETVKKCLDEMSNTIDYDVLNSDIFYKQYPEIKEGIKENG